MRNWKIAFLLLVLGFTIVYPKMRNWKWRRRHEKSPCKAYPKMRNWKIKEGATATDNYEGILKWGIERVISHNQIIGGVIYVS